MSSSESGSTQPEPIRAPDMVREIDPLKRSLFQQSLREQQRFGLAVVAGAGAAVLGAFIWALVAYWSGYRTAIMAILVGAGVGYTIQKTGRGVEEKFGYVGASFSILGCLLGQILAMAAFIAKQEAASLLLVLWALMMKPLVLVQVAVAGFSFLDIVFYGLALYQGYKLSFRQITAEEKESLYRLRPRA